MEILHNTFWPLAYVECVHGSSWDQVHIYFFLIKSLEMKTDRKKNKLFSLSRSDIYPCCFIYPGFTIVISDILASTNLVSVIDLLSRMQQCTFLLLSPSLRRFVLLQALKYPISSDSGPVLLHTDLQIKYSTAIIVTVITTSQLLSGSDVQTLSLMLQDITLFQKEILNLLVNFDCVLPDL